MSANVCIYHAGCIDGFGAATVVNKALPYCVFHEGVYNKPPPDVTNCHVYLVDFSYRREVLEKMLEQALSITIIDHHKSAMQDLASLEHPRLTKHLHLKHSGAVLTWLYFFPGTIVPQLLRHIEDRDLWLKKWDTTDFICAALYSYDFDFKVWDAFYENVEALIPEGKTLQRDRAKHTELALGTAPEWVKIDGHSVPILNASRSIASELAQQLAVMYNTPFAGVYQDRNGKRVFSLRPSRGFDVSEIAFSLGGGGHKNAAGFSVPIHKMKTLRPSLMFRIKRFFVPKILNMFTL